MFRPVVPWSRVNPDEIVAPVPYVNEKMMTVLPSVVPDGNVAVYVVLVVEPVATWTMSSRLNVTGPPLPDLAGRPVDVHVAGLGGSRRSGAGDGQLGLDVQRHIGAAGGDHRVGRG